jgi:hypothetical protein
LSIQARGRTWVERETAAVASYAVDRGQRGGETIEPVRVVGPYRRAAGHAGRDDEPSGRGDAAVTEEPRSRRPTAVQQPQRRPLSPGTVAVGKQAHDDRSGIGGH